jgi:hypothetical protein
VLVRPSQIEKKDMYLGCQHGSLAPLLDLT